MACSGNQTSLEIEGYKRAVALESYPAGSYTYVLASYDGKETWFACPATEIEVGENYYFKDEMIMNNFQSKETGRFFESILFVQELSKNPLTPNHQEEFTHPVIPQHEQNIGEVKQVAQGELHYGKAIETMNATRYTYMYADENGEKKWLAFPKTLIILGKTYQWSDPMLMTNFESKELKKTFDNIWFVSGVTESAPNQKTNIEQKTVVSSDASKVLIGDLLAHKKKFEGQTVTIQGKVIKYNAEIMGVNWLHVQDESGTAEITVTSTNSSKVGSMVICTGKVILNKDFGAGYKYDILIEQAILK